MAQQVVNIRDFGGLKQAAAAGVMYCGRPSALGNPFRMEREEDRDEVIEKYRRWLWDKIKSRDKAVMAAFEAMDGDELLGCWCAPKRCHCDVIRRAWEWLQVNA